MSPAGHDGAVGPAWSDLLRQAVARLTEAGVDSPRADAEQLLAHVFGADRGTVLAAVLRGDSAGHAAAQRFEDVVARRAARTPLQHLTGRTWFHGVELQVGPGVFLPRPETETLVELALTAARERAVKGSLPVCVADLCTGSGAVAAAVAAGLWREDVTAEVMAVELDPRAHAWARCNLEPHGVELMLGDAYHAWPERNGCVDVVVSNPPYVPEGRLPTQPEAGLDPALALYGGDARGTLMPLRVAAAAARLLAPGGTLAMEHDETHADELVADLRAMGVWKSVTGWDDLTGRPRFVTAVRVPSATDPSVIPELLKMEE